MALPGRCDHCAAPLDPGLRYCAKCGGVVAWNTQSGEAPSPIRAFLLVHLPGGVVRKDALGKTVLRIGRGRDCEIAVDHPRVSRLHAILELRDGAYLLSDARSSGGTFLDDRPVHGPTALKSGSTIRLGRIPEDSVTLVYHLGE